MKGMSGAVLADLAANLLVATLVVLIVLARTSSLPPDHPTAPLTATAVAPVSGGEAVELLRQRLLPGPVGLADLDPQAQAPDQPIRALFILDPTGYSALVASQSGQPDWQELTVPQALKTNDNHWSPDFLALAEVADDPERFRVALQVLLERGPDNGIASTVAGTGAGSAGSRILAWFWAALDLLGLTALLIAGWALLRLRRWTIRA